MAAFDIVEAIAVARTATCSSRAPLTRIQVCAASNYCLKSKSHKCSPCAALPVWSACCWPPLSTTDSWRVTWCKGHVLQALGYYVGMLCYYWVLATPAVGWLFGCYLYICVNWFGVHYDEVRYCTQ